MGALVVAVLSGMVWMVVAGAPPHYPVINGVALIAALGLSRLRIPVGTVFAMIVTALFWLPLVIGPELDGVRRWVSIGPVTLHIGMLVLPTLVVILHRLTTPWSLALVMAATAAIAFQPDTASALALATGLAAIALKHQTRVAIGAAMISLIGFAVTLYRPDPLQPVHFVETVFQDAWVNHPVLAVAMGVAVINLLVARRPSEPNDQSIAAVIAGFTVASLFGAYPVPFIGYGTAAILGYGLAIAAARTDHRALRTGET
jgi:uncharacterized membrane protein YhdT